MLAAVLGLSLSIFSWLGAPALPADCDVPDPVVTVIPLNPGFTVDHSKSRSELSGMIGSKAFPGFYTQGLTDVSYATRPRMLIETRQLADGRWCSTLKKVTVEFGLPDPAKVHLAREIPENSCRYVTVLAHEMQHVAISQKAVAQGADALRALLRDKGARYLSYGADEVLSGDALKSVVERDIVSVTGRFLAQAEFQNGAIDTRPSYEALSAQCPGGAD